MVYYSGSSFTRYAMDKANEFGGFSNKATTKLHNDSYDAYRHALLSAKLTSYFGDNFAKDFLDDHEKDNPNPASETNMDKWNNNIGRQKYHNWKSATEAGETSKSLDEWIYDKVKEGKTINDPTNDSRTWVEPENSSLPSSNGGWYDNGHQCLKPWAKDVNRNGKSYGYDPLILDLGGNGIETIFVAGFSGSLFDHNNDGIRTATGWISAGDGLLVRDLNGNGLIDNGSELFGNNTRLANGATAAHGYAALAELDSNHDNLINQADELFSSLKVWQDINQDGISQSNE
ncbi:DUF6973 domain-containing protein, partial [Kingella kingae]|nr:hypothetical protein [Kingella kingae]